MLFNVLKCISMLQNALIKAFKSIAKHYKALRTLKSIKSIAKH